MNKRVALLTGGGDVPGLNMCLKSLTYRVIDAGYDVLGVRKGWEGFINYDPQDPSTFGEHFIELTKNRVRTIDQTSGSFLHSSRLDPGQIAPERVPSLVGSSHEKSVDATDHIARAIGHLGLEALLVLGDDDMLRYASKLSQSGVPIIAIPKTIHNNIRGTDYSLGFSTGLARGVDFIHQLRALAGSREQIVVVESFGDRSGFSALLMAYLAGVDRVIIPEVPYDPALLAYLVSQDKQLTPSNYAIVSVTHGSRIAADKLDATKAYLTSYNYAEVIAEAQSAGGSPALYHSGGLIAAELLHNLTGEEVFFQQLTYLMRTGAPDGQDLLGASNFALMATHLLQNRNYGRMTAFLRKRTWTHVDLAAAAREPKFVDTEQWYNTATYQPTDGLIWSSMQ